MSEQSIRFVAGLPIKDYMREYNQKYYQKPEVKAKKREYNQKPEVKAKQREYQQKYHQKPKVKAKKREYNQKYYQKPEVKAKQREYQQKYHQKPEVKAKKREYNQKRLISSDVLVNDFNSYKHRLNMRGVLEKKDEPKLDYSFVENVDRVIDGGTELKVASKLGIKYKEQAYQKACGE